MRGPLWTNKGPFLLQDARQNVVSLRSITVREKDRDRTSCLFSAEVP